MKKLLYKLFIEKTDKTLLQLFRYGFVGGTAFIIDYATLFLLTHYAGIPYLWSAAIAFVLGLITNYLLSISWVFQRDKSRSTWSEFVVFAIIGVIGLVFNELVMYVGTDLLHLHYMLSKLISTALVFFWNFFARKYTLFNKES